MTPLPLRETKRRETSIVMAEAPNDAAPRSGAGAPEREERFDREFERRGHEDAVVGAAATGDPAYVIDTLVTEAESHTGRSIGSRNPALGPTELFPPVHKARPDGIDATRTGGSSLPFLVRVNYDRGSNTNYNTIEVIKVAKDGTRTTTEADLMLAASTNNAHYVLWHHTARWRLGVDVWVAITSDDDSEASLRVLSLDLNGAVRNRRVMSDPGSQLAAASTAMISGGSGTLLNAPHASPIEASGFDDNFRGLVLQSYDSTSGPRTISAVVSDSAEVAKNLIITGAGMMAVRGISTDSVALASTGADSVVSGCSGGGHNAIIAMHQDTGAGNSTNVRVARFTMGAAASFNLGSYFDIRVPAGLSVSAMNGSFMLGARVLDDDSWWAAILFDLDTPTELRQRAMAVVRYAPARGGSTEWVDPAGTLGVPQIGFAGVTVRHGAGRTEQPERLLSPQDAESPFVLAAQRVDPDRTSSVVRPLPATAGGRTRVCHALSDLGIYAYVANGALGLKQAPRVVVMDLLQSREVAALHLGAKADENGDAGFTEAQTALLAAIVDAEQCSALQFVQTGDDCVELVLSAVKARPTAGIETTADLTGASNEIRLFRFVGRRGMAVV